MAKIGWWGLEALIVIGRVTEQYFLEGGYLSATELSEDELETLEFRINKAYPSEHSGYDFIKDLILGVYKNLLDLPKINY